MPKIMQEYNNYAGVTDLLDQEILLYHSDAGCCSCECMDGISNCKQTEESVIFGSKEEDSISIFEQKK
jgi:hypothetical protein